MNYTSSRPPIHVLALVVLLTLILSADVFAMSPWQPLRHQPAFVAGQSLLLTDGTVIVQNVQTSDWYRLTPDRTGSYVKGTWSIIAPMPAGYGPLYYASAVLADGRVVAMGGEYNANDNGGGGVWTKKGAIYNPVKNVWSRLEAPRGWSNVGDAQSVVLSDGQWLLADCCQRKIALLDPKSLTWAALTSHGKSDSNDEEGWTLLPDRTVLTVDAFHPLNSERYFPALDSWMSAGSTNVTLADPNSGEVGPGVVLPDRSVFYAGACQSDYPSLNGDGNCVAPGHTAIYHPPASVTGLGEWTTGPDFPDGLDVADGPMAVLPSGRVLLMASPGVYKSGAQFFEFDGKTLQPVPGTPNAVYDPSYSGVMLVLPTGQVMLTDQSNDIEIYTSPGLPDPKWAPSITSWPLYAIQGQTFSLAGIQLNGVTSGSAYGDDSQNNTNYPLIRVQNLATKDVTFWRTHDHSSMGVNSGLVPVTTHLDVPKSATPGIYLIEVVTNGIASEPRPVWVLP